MWASDSPVVLYEYLRGTSWLGVTCRICMEIQCNRGAATIALISLHWQTSYMLIVTIGGGFLTVVIVGGVLLLQARRT
jgi:hypothetical protein